MTAPFTIAEYPEPYRAYDGVGQAVNIEGAGRFNQFFIDQLLSETFPSATEQMRDGWGARP